MDTPLTKYADLMPIIEKMATDIANQIVEKRLNESQYNVPKTPDHHHNGLDSVPLGTEALPIIQTLTSRTNGVLDPNILVNQSVSQASNFVGYGNQIDGNNQSSRGVFTVYPTPIIYGHGVGTDSDFHAGDAQEGSMVFFNNGPVLSGLWIRSGGSWFGIGQATPNYRSTII